MTDRSPRRKGGVQVRWSESNRRAFKNGLWPIIAVLALLNVAVLALRVSAHGTGWTIAAAVVFTAGAVAGALGKLPVRRNRTTK
jgi:hypothetical protein